MKSHKKKLVPHKREQNNTTYQLLECCDQGSDSGVEQPILNKVRKWNQIEANQSPQNKQQIPVKLIKEGVVFSH